MEFVSASQHFGHVARLQFIQANGTAVPRGIIRIALGVLAALLVFLVLERRN